MPLDLTDDKSTLVQVMAWGRQAQAITWSNVDPDLCRQLAPLAHNELPNIWQNVRKLLFLLVDGYVINR